jgi:anti-sigma regulatory factor (Ser/Thr protein kinase)
VAGPLTHMDTEYATGGGFSHEAVLYRQPADYRSAVLAFVRDGLASDEPALVAVPAAAAEALHPGLDGQSGVELADMGQLGRNPGRIIAAAWDFAERHPGRAVRFVSEPVWPGRSPAEIREAAAHEAMVNLAFATAPVAMLCLYDAGRLPSAVVTVAARTHPVTRMPDGARDSSAYQAGFLPDGASFPLPAPPGRALRLPYTSDLRSVRSSVARYAGEAGLTADRLADLVIAVGEVIANTLRHTGQGGLVSIWYTRAEVICQVSDTGRIADPLVGRRRPVGPGGLGLWVVHQVCDLVEFRSGAGGTCIRMHMQLTGNEAAL